MIDFDKGDTVRVILEFKAPQVSSVLLGSIDVEWFRTFACQPMTILDVKVTKPEREWFFGDSVTLKDHPSEGFTFIDSDSTGTSMFISDDMQYALDPENDAYDHYGPYRLVAIHGRNLKVRGE